jgi:hypothetical protein
VIQASPENQLPDKNSVVVGELLAYQIILWAGVIFMMSTLLFWLTIPIGAYQFWVGLVIALYLGKNIAQNDGVWIKGFMSLVGAAIICALSTEWFFDFSGDGQEYHLPAILALAGGWNPFMDTRLAEWNPAFKEAITSGIYVQHYSKGAWILAAATYRATGLLEGAKMWNLLYPLAVFLLSVITLRRLALGRFLSFGLAAVVALNPVILYQFDSFYVDGQLASMYTLVILVSLEYLRRPASYKLLLIILCLVVLANLKFTGLVYGGLLVVGISGLAWLLKMREGLKRYTLATSVAMVMAVTWAGYQPYITNTLQQGHPFYPALGREDGRNVQWHTASPEFLAMNRVEKLVRSLFASSSGDMEIPQFKMPLSLDRQEIYTYFTADVKYGGFGPMFGGVLILLLLMLPFLLSAGAPVAPVALGVMVVLTALPNPEAWWARLSPQIWLLAPLLILPAAYVKLAWIRRFGFAVMILLLMNVAVIVAAHLGRSIQKNVDYRHQIRVLSMGGDPPIRVQIPLRFRLVTEWRLHRHGVAYTLVDQIDCQRSLHFSYPEANRSAACLNNK